MSSLQPNVLSVRALFVAAAAATLGLLALANLSPTTAGPRSMAEAPSFGVPVVARVVYKPAPPVIVSQADQLSASRRR
jgi:hypothetical protein